MRSLRAATSRSLRRSIAFSSLRRSSIRFSTSRRSTSNCFSPGPRMPMPIFSRDKWVHIRLSRGSEYCNCASSTARRASCVWARLAKMSRISSVRSSTLTPVAFSRLRVWAGREIVVEDDHVGVGRRGQLLQLVDLALAEIGGHVGRLAALGQLADDARAGRVGQPCQFLQRVAMDFVIRQARRRPGPPLRWRRSRRGSFLSRAIGSSR